MQVKDIKDLSYTARIDLSDSEAEGLLHDLAVTLDYVDQVSKAPLTGDEVSLPENRNVVREDVVTTVTGSYTAVLLSSVVGQQDGFVKVKKIM